jgi:transcriptional regulator with XRE-family HTH domain
MPKTQAELIRLARGSLTQAQFSRDLGIDRSCLSRYEREKLGVPIKVLNYCLGAIAAQISTNLGPIQSVEQALAHARQTVSLLEVSSQIPSSCS